MDRTYKLVYVEPDDNAEITIPEEVTLIGVTVNMATGAPVVVGILPIDVWEEKYEAEWRKKQEAEEKENQVAAFRDHKKKEEPHVHKSPPVAK